MASDLNKPISTDLYADVLQYIRDNFAALAKGLDPAVVTPANIPTYAIRWELTTNKRLEKYNGSSWANAEPAGGYAINISGSAAKWTTGRTLTFTGAATGTSGTFDGSANISIALTQTTVPVNKGGTNITSYTVGDILYASGATTLAKRAAVATGYALISGGVGAAPAWGKVGLTTHISGTLAIGNGGTGATTAAAARTALGLVIGTDVLGMGGGTLSGALAATNLSGTNTGDEVQATTTVAGKMQTSTNAETQSQTSTTVAVTPASLGACTATTTRKGVIATATDAVAQAKASTAVALTPSNLAALVFESAELACPVAGTEYSVAHGLGGAPVSMEMVLRCKTAEHGYVAGDEIVLTNNYGYYAGVWNSWKNATYVGAAFNTTLGFCHKDTSAFVGPTAANWRIVLRASLI